MFCPTPAERVAQRLSVCRTQLPAEGVDKGENHEGLSWGWIPLPRALSQWSASP